MALSQATLAGELENLVPTISAASASATIAIAFGEYMKAATVGPMSIVGASVDSLAVPAMAAAMTFDSGDTEADGAAVIGAGLTAFWATMAAAPGAFFVGAVVITPAPSAAIVSAIATIFEDKTRTVEEAADAMATAIHSSTDNIGTASNGVSTSPIT